jgi:chromosome segregation ATPase
MSNILERHGTTMARTTPLSLQLLIVLSSLTFVYTESNCVNLSDTLHSVQSDYKASMNRIQRLESERTTIKEVSNGSEMDLEELDKKYKETKLGVHQSRAELKFVQEQLKDVQERANRAGVLVNSTQVHLEANRTDARVITGVIDSLQSERENLQNSIRKSELRLDILQTDIDTLNGTTTSLVDRLRLDHERMDSLTALNSRDEKLHREMIAVVEAARNNVHNISTRVALDRTALTDVTDSLADMDQTTGTLQRTKKGLVDQIDQSRVAIESWRNKFDSYVNSSTTTSYATIRELRTGVKRIANTLREYRVEAVDAPQVNDESDDENTSESLVGEAQDVLRQNRAFLLKHGYNQLSLFERGPVVQQPRVPRGSEPVSALTMKARLISLHEDSQGLSERLHQLSSDETQFELDLKLKEAHMSDLLRGLESLEQKTASLDTSIANLTQSRAILLSRQHTVRASLETDIPAERMAQSTYRNVSETLAKLEERVRRSSITLHRLNETSEADSSSLRTKREELEAIMNDSRNTTASLVRDKERLMAVEYQLSVQRKQLVDLTSAISRLSDDLEHHRSILSDALAEVAHTGRRMGEKLHGLEDMEKKYRVLEGERNESKRSIAEILRKRSNLDSQLDAENAMRMELSEHVRSLKHQLEASRCIDVLNM